MSPSARLKRALVKLKLAIARELLFAISISIPLPSAWALETKIKSEGDSAFEITQGSMLKNDGQHFQSTSDRDQLKLRSYVSLANQVHVANCSLEACAGEVIARSSQGVLNRN